MKKALGVVRVELTFVNYWGDVTERTTIGEFRCMPWAREFIKMARKNEDGLCKVAVSVCDGKQFKELSREAVDAEIEKITEE